RRGGERASGDAQTRELVAGSLGVVDRDLEPVPRGRAGASQVAPGLHARPPQAVVDGGPRGQVHGPSLGDPAEVEPHAGREPDEVAVELDLGPATAGLARVERV